MEIPHYPHSIPLELRHKLLLDPLLPKLDPIMSELTFASLYLFRKAHEYRLAAVEDSIVVLGKPYGGGDDYVLPPLSGNAGAAAVFLLERGVSLYCDKRFLEIPPLNEGGFSIEEDRDSFDYLYRRADLADLPGNRYHKKKNRINYFAKRHDFSVELYSPVHRQGCLQLLEEWQRVRAELENLSALLEVEAAREGIELAEQLEMQGVVVLVEGRVRAFALGERLNHNTAVCHFEKADPFLEGLYQLVNREFCRLAFTDCTYVNREQDLGEPNLRETKLSYHPAELVKKFRVRRSL